MSKLKHTPAPWAKTGKLTNNTIINCASRTVAENVYNVHDANLIIAAPKMLTSLTKARIIICELCVRLNPHHKGCSSCPQIEDEIDSIIENATGLKIEDVLND